MIQELENAPISIQSKYEIEKEIQKELSMEYKKPNVISINGKFNFTAFQQDIMNYVFYKFTNLDYENKKLRVFYTDIFDTLKIKKEDKNYSYIRKAIKSITDSSIEIKYLDENKEEHITPFRFILDYDSNKRQNYIDLYFKDIVLNIIIYQLKTYYTTFNFYHTLKLKGKFAKRFYDLFFAETKIQEEYRNKNGINKDSDYSFFISVEQLKQEMYLNYKTPSEIKRRVIEPALKEINANTRLNARYIYKNNRFTFYWNCNSDIFKQVQEISQAYENLYNKINKAIKEETKELKKNDKKISPYGISFIE